PGSWGLYGRAELLGGGGGAPAPPGTVEVVATFDCPAPATEVRFTTSFVPGDPAASHRFAGSGVGVGDLDGDDRLDLVVPGPTRLRTWRQTGPPRAPRFAPFPLAPTVEASGAEATATALADVDGDGDLDVYVARFGPPDALLLNDGAGRLVPVDDPVIGVPHHGQSVAFVDLDADGRLDIVVSGHGPVAADEGQTAIDGPADPTRLLMQQPAEGLGRFVDVGPTVSPDAQAAYTFVATPTHLDADGRIDLLLANDFPVFRPNQALRQVDGGYQLAPETGLHVAAAGMGVAASDLNDDGWDDFVLPVWNRLVHLRSIDGTSPHWVEAQSATGLLVGRPDPAWIGWGADFGDLDADGRVDLVVGFGHLDTVGVRTAGGTSAANALEQPDQVWSLESDGTFLRRTWGLEHRGVTRGVLVVDLDHDGWLDVVRRDLEGPVRVDHAACGLSHTLEVALEPPSAAVGATVALRAGPQWLTRTVRAGGISLGSAGPPEAHFGLGEHTEVRDLTITWPDGLTTAVPGRISADRRLRIRRP
ncbi:MAG: CRTAC1 family protein, partial [Myxococcota bacterium]